MSVFSSLKTLIFSGNLVVERLGDNALIETLSFFKNIDRINKTQIIPKLLQDLFEVERQKWEMENERILQKELEAAKDNIAIDE